MVVSEADGLSGSSRALLAALYPKTPEIDPGWQEEGTIWQRVDDLHPRLALILACRFGRHLGRPLPGADRRSVVGGARGRRGDP